MASETTIDGRAVVDGGASRSANGTAEVVRAHRAAGVRPASPAQNRAPMLVLAADALAAAGALAGALLLTATPDWSWHLITWLVVAAGAVVASMAIAGLYDLHRFTAWHETRRVIGAGSVGLVLAASLAVGAAQALHGPRLGAGWTLLLVALLGERWAGRVLRRRRPSRPSTRRAVVLGGNHEALRIDRALLTGGALAPVGFVLPTRESHTVDDDHVLGTLDELERHVAETRADCLVVASTAFTSHEMLEIIRRARAMGIAVHASTGLPRVLEHRLTVRPLGDDCMAVCVAAPQLTGLQLRVKRAFDVAGAAALLGILAAPMALIALAVRLTSPGPALFRQRRVTQGGRDFTMLKFRTMAADDRVLPAESERAAPFFKMDGADPRITRLGHLLRRTSLDELPQLWNVLRGDMSLVGPRPLPAEQVAANVELLEGRHQVRAGITGWWQIQGRSDLAPEESVELDLFYIDNWSIGLDLFILLRTAGAVASGRGAY